MGVEGVVNCCYDIIVFTSRAVEVSHPSYWDGRRQNYGERQQVHRILATVSKWVVSLGGEKQADSGCRGSPEDKKENTRKKRVCRATERAAGGKQDAEGSLFQEERVRSGMGRESSIVAGAEEQVAPNSAGSFRSLTRSWVIQNVDKNSRSAKAGTPDWTWVGQGDNYHHYATACKWTTFNTQLSSYRWARSKPHGKNFTRLLGRVKTTTHRRQRKKSEEWNVGSAHLHILLGCSIWCVALKVKLTKKNYSPSRFELHVVPFKTGNVPLLLFLKENLILLTVEKFKKTQKQLK